MFLLLLLFLHCANFVFIEINFFSHFDICKNFNFMNHVNKTVACFNFYCFNFSTFLRIGNIVNIKISLYGIKSYMVFYDHILNCSFFNSNGDGISYFTYNISYQKSN